MVFVKFHNMNRKKKFLMSPLTSNSKNFSLYNKSKQCYNHSSKMFSFLFFFFNLCTDVLSILLKMSVLSFFFICCVQQYSSVFSFFFHFFPSSLSCSFFSFCFFSVFIFFSFFLFIINCSFNVSFFSNLISTSLCPYLNTITIGSLPSLFNFDL